MKQFNVDYLIKERLEEANRIQRYAEKQRALNRMGNQGYSKDRTRKYLGSFGYDTLFHPEFSKYFHPGQDVHEFKKNVLAFFKKFPSLKGS